MAAPVHLTPATTDHALAEDWFRQFEGAGLDGLIAKPLTGTYEPDKRVMFKVKHERTADCVVAGYRPHKTGPEAVGSLLLGLYTDSGDLASVGVIGAFPMARRKELLTEMQPLVTTFDGPSLELGSASRPRAGGAPRTQPPVRGDEPVERGQGPVVHPAPPGTGGRGPLRPHGGPRFRHTTQFVRWRPDRDPRSCTYAQLEEPVSFDLARSSRPESADLRRLTRVGAAGQPPGLARHTGTAGTPRVRQHVSQGQPAGRRRDPGPWIIRPARPRPGAG